jgi:hypothetical protein
MTKWIINIGDPVLISLGGEKYEGRVLAQFCFRSTKHYIVQVGDTFMCSTIVQPNKKPEPLAFSKGGR